jgi:PAS domain-containing protein
LRHFKDCWSRSARRPGCIPNWAAWAGNPPSPLRALDQLAAAVIVADSDGRVIEMHRTAERILQRGDGLTIRNGKLGALHAFDTTRLEAFIVAAPAEQKTVAATGRMHIRRHDGHPPYILTVAPLGADWPSMDALWR